MKILYIASERSRAQVATRALRSVSPHATILWGSNYERAAFGILENPDLAALVVEVQSDKHGCSYLKQLHSLGLQAPVVVVLPEGAGSPVESLKAGAGGYVAKGPSFSQELPAVVFRTLGHPQAPTVVRKDDRRSQTAAGSAVKVPVERRASDLATPVQQREQHRDADTSAAAEREAKLETLLQQEREIRKGVEQKLVETNAALQEAKQGHVSATNAAAQLAERNTQHETSMARAAATQKLLEEQLRQSRQSRASAFADVERLTVRNTELTSRLTEVTATSNTLERELAEIKTALAAANERTSDDRAGIADQLTEHVAKLQAQLEQEVENRRKLEEELARAKKAHEEAEKQRSSVVTAATALWAERQAHFDAELATAAEARTAVDREARELQAALDQAQQTIQADAATVEQLTQREAALTSQLAEAAAIRSTLERQLAQATETLKEADQGASRNRLTAATKAAERELEFEGLIRQERATRADVEGRLAQMETGVTEREAALRSQLAEAATVRTTLERQVADTANALKLAEESIKRERRAVETKVAAFVGLVRQERALRADVEGRLAQAEAALRAAEEQHASAMTVAGAERVDQQAHFDAELAKAVEARQAHATEVERLIQGEAALRSQLADASTIRSTLERQLLDVADALKAAEERAAEDRRAAETNAAAFEGVIREERATRAEVEGRLAQAEVALRDAEQRHASAMAMVAIDAERQTQRETELSSQLAEAAIVRTTLDRQLADTTDALKAAQERASRDRLAAESTAAEREVEFERLFGDERATRADVERRLRQVEAALREAQEQHASAMAAAATERAERQAQFDAELAETAATREHFKRRFSEAETALADARHNHATATTEVERLMQREADLTSQLTEVASARSALERQLADTADALKGAEEAASRDRLAAESKAAEREVEFERLLGDQRAVRADVEEQLAQLEAAMREAQAQHASAMAAAATERAEREARFDVELAETAATRDDFKRRFSEAETALAAARHDHAAAASQVERLTQRESELTSQLAEAATVRTTLERQLTDTADALKSAEETANRDRLAAESTAAEREVEFERLFGDERATRADAERRLGQVEAALREAQEQHASAMAAAATERAERQAQFDAELAETAATRDDFKHRFSEADTALAAARHDHATAATEVERLTGRETELTSQIVQVEAALRKAHEQHASAMATAATERAEREAQLATELSQTAATRDDFKRRFSDADTALAAARHDHAVAATEVERLTHREAELTSQLADAAAIRSALERQLADTADALKAAQEDANRDRLAAERKAAERESEFERLFGDERATRIDVEGRLSQEIAHRDALDRTVAEMRSAAADAEERFRVEIATLTARARHQVTELEVQFGKEREAHKDRQARLLNEIENLEAARGALDESLNTIREQSRLREIDHQQERDRLDGARLAAETEVRRLAAELSDVRQNLEAARKDFQQTLDRVSNEHADSLAKLGATVGERDARIEDVEKQLEESRLELRRQFLRAPLPLWRCTRDGALTHANRALADLVGYRQPEDVRGGDFVRTVFESTDDLSWLIERCLSTKARQSVETEWKRKNGERFVVRLSAVEFGPDVIEIAVEDVTAVCVLEDRLAQAHRMEAVARLASEIAITCGRLLGDVHADGQQWLMAVSGDTALRKRGERLLGEVARAATYLERLAAHGDEQTSALQPVELNRVLRDLKPVLKHVAGDDVEVELSKTSSALNVDMKADRVERLLVNLASYGRERMPFGGRLKIELATVLVDQKFIADHPNVRRGHHALITVTTMRRTMPANAGLHTGATEPTSNDAASQKPGVDLGALQELLQECGGHLWLTVEPPGNMVVKIRLPLRVWDDRPQPTTSDPPTSRKRGVPDTQTSHKRVMPRWFRH